MKKLLFIFGMLLCVFTMPVHAERTRANVYRWNHGSISGDRERSSIYLPIIDIVFEPKDQSIEILCSLECDATVFVYDSGGNLIAGSDSMNEILYIPKLDNTTLYIIIESELWYATATIGS